MSQCPCKILLQHHTFYCTLEYGHVLNSMQQHRFFIDAEELVLSERQITIINGFAMKQTRGMETSESKI